MHSPQRAVVPYAFDPKAAQNLHGSFSLRLRGVEPVRFPPKCGGIDNEDCDVREENEVRPGVP